MIVMQNAPVDMLMYYDANVMSPYCGLFNPIDHGVFNTYYSFYIFGQLYALGEQVECYSDRDGVYVLAARGEQGSAIAIVNHTGEKQQISLSFEGETGENAKIFSVDEDRAFLEVDEDLSCFSILPNGLKFVKFGSF